MRLSDKLRFLREMEGSLRGRERGLTQGELVCALREQTGKILSQSCLSQTEPGTRPQTANSPTPLTRSFRFRAGRLVGDPDGHRAELPIATHLPEERLEAGPVSVADRFRMDAELRYRFKRSARHRNSREGAEVLGNSLKARVVAGNPFGVPRTEIPQEPGSVSRGRICKTNANNASISHGDSR